MHRAGRRSSRDAAGAEPSVLLLLPLTSASSCRCRSPQDKVMLHTRHPWPWRGESLQCWSAGRQGVRWWAPGAAPGAPSFPRAYSSPAEQTSRAELLQAAPFPNTSTTATQARAGRSQKATELWPDRRDIGPPVTNAHCTPCTPGSHWGWQCWNTREP